jgi:glutathione S-transferase
MKLPKFDATVAVAPDISKELIVLTLYEHPLSPYAQKNKIALREKGVEFTATSPEGIGAGDSGLDFLTANPRGEVPVLVDGDTTVFDSTVILEYIEDRWPTPALLPETPRERARVRMIEDVMDTHFEAINWGLGEIAYFKRVEGAEAAAIVTKAGDQITGFYDWLERELGSSQWFNGDAFGWGDLSVIPYLNGSASFGHRPASGTRLADWLERANRRPSVAQTATEATASTAGMASVADLLEKGLFKREYRDHRLEWMIKTAGLEVIAKGLAKDNIRFVDGFS